MWVLVLTLFSWWKVLGFYFFKILWELALRNAMVHNMSYLWLRCLDLRGIYSAKIVQNLHPYSSLFWNMPFWLEDQSENWTLMDSLVFLQPHQWTKALLAFLVEGFMSMRWCFFCFQAFCCWCWRQYWVCMHFYGI